MKVIQIPVYHNNPYHFLLAQSLAKHGVQVELVDQFNLLFPLSKIVKVKRPDIIHLHWHYSFIFSSKGYLRTLIKLLIFLVDLVKVKSAGCRLVWTIHNKHHHENLYPIIDSLSVKILSRLADAVEVKGKATKEFALRQIGVSPKKLHVILHGNYIALRRKILIEECRSKLKIDRERVVFLYLGLIRPYKGVSELIEAFKPLEHALLIVAGEVKNHLLEREIRRAAEGIPHIRLFLRFIETTELNELFATSDVFVAPYRDILTSGSIVLAMSFSKPVIAPNIGCIPEYLSKDNNFLYSPNTTETLAKALARASKLERQILKKMGHANFLKAKHDLDWGKIAERTINMYKEIL